MVPVTGVEKKCEFSWFEALTFDTLPTHINPWHYSAKFLFCMLLNSLRLISLIFRIRSNGINLQLYAMRMPLKLIYFEWIQGIVDNFLWFDHKHFVWCVFCNIIRSLVIVLIHIRRHYLWATGYTVNRENARRRPMELATIMAFTWNQNVFRGLSDAAVYSHIMSKIDYHPNPIFTHTRASECTERVVAALTVCVLQNGTRLYLSAKHLFRMGNFFFWQ